MIPKTFAVGKGDLLPVVGGGLQKFNTLALRVTVPFPILIEKSGSVALQKNW